VPREAAMIAEPEIARLKNGVNLVELVRSRGVELQRKGRSFMGRCPFHEDGKTPSLSISAEKGLWHCFGCGAGGDAIRFLELHDRLGFRDAVRVLGGAGAPANKEAAKEEDRAPAVAAVPATTRPRVVPSRSELLRFVVDLYHANFKKDARGRDYLAERGIRGGSALDGLEIGLAGKLRDGRSAEEIEDLKAIGVLTERGTELFYGCVVFPLEDAEGRIVSLYGRRILSGELRHLYLPGPRRGLFNRQGARGARELIFVEGVIDALALIGAGYKNTLALDGTEGLRSEHLELLHREKVRTVYLALDGDDAGREATKRIAERLGKEDVCTLVISLPDGKDPAELVRECGAEAFAALLRQATATTAGAAAQSEPPGPEVEQTAEGLRACFGERGERVYELRGIARPPGRLRCALRAARGSRFHPDALDLYSARARQSFARAAAQALGVAESTIAEDLRHLVEHAEGWQPKEAKPVAPAAVMSDGEREAALAVLRAPDLLDQIQRDLGIVGTVGEEENRLLGYFAALSRKLSEPLSVLIVSRSAAGKSHLAESVTRLVPPEDLRRYTRVTGQALFYTEEDALRHKLVSIEEAAGAEEAAYSIRTLQSAGELRVAVTTKDPRDGRLRTDEYTVKGPASFLVTSTASELDPETQSRFLVLSVDESAATTERILQAQREAETLDGLRRRREADAMVRRHHAMQRLLEPVSVVIPFAPKLRFPARTLRARRDHKKYLGLIQTVAFLHQHQRERKQTEVGGESVTYIEASPADVALVARLARAAFARTLDELSPQARSLLAEIRTLCEEQAAGEVLEDYSFRRRDLRRRSGCSETQLRQHLGELEQHEIVDAVAGRQGKEYVYHLAYDEQGRPLALDLASEEELLRG
jgi:DNA primase catalytic core